MHKRKRLQWKVNKKTRQVSDPKGKTIATRRYLKGLQPQYEKAFEVLDQLRAQWHKIGPTLIDPPSPLRSEAGQTDGEETQESGQEDPDAHMTAYSDDQNEWQQLKWQSKRQRRMLQVPCQKDSLPSGSHSQRSNLD